MALKFPSDLQQKYFCSISFSEYRRPDPFSSLMQLYSQPGSSGDIILPLPANLVDTQKLNWAQGGSSFGEAITDGIQLAGGQVSIEEVLASVGTSAIGSAGFLAGIVGGLAGLPDNTNINQVLTNGVDATTKAVLQKNGLALNPVLSQQFNHPDFKVHQFSWKMSPDSASESGTLEAIIDTIKYNALPDVAAGGMFFKYPSIANIKLITGSKELYKFQPCVISDISVNYAPSNTPSFFAGTSGPTSVQITVTFLEIILNTRKNTKRSSGIATDLALGQNSSAFINRGLAVANSILNNKKAQ